MPKREKQVSRTRRVPGPLAAAGASVAAAAVAASAAPRPRPWSRLSRLAVHAWVSRASPSRR